MWMRARIRIQGPLELHLGGVGWYSWLDVPVEGTLNAAQTAGPPVVRDLTGNFAPHGVVLGEIGAIYDSRDNEILTREGGYHTVTLRVSPAVTAQLPYGYQQVNGTSRFYWTPRPWLTVAWRGVADVLLGDPPFYELERFEETSALGGLKGVRGVPAQRYYGKVKILQNLEVRSDVWDFRIRGKDYVLATAAFFDAGRVWTELGRRHPDLDGRGIGLKYGVGGGLRLQQGKTFVVRLDVAWSPDADPVGAYFAAGQIF
jgi:outer membrane protein assembly factor BamA